MTNRDYIEIVSTFMSMSNPIYRCHDCVKRYKYEPERRKKLETGMACKEAKESFVHEYRPDDYESPYPQIRYKSCVGNYYYGKWTGIINTYKKWEDGIFPFSGGYMEQPAKYTDVMSLVGNLILEDQKSKEAKVNGKRKNIR